MHSKINKIIEALEATNEDISAFAGYDRSNISRLRNGSRKLYPGSRTVRKFVDGVYEYASMRGKLPVLCDITGVDPELDPSGIKTGILEWLYEGEPYRTIEAYRERPYKRKESARLFGERLDLAMNWAGLSNAKLSQLINVDASLISRFRSGTRMPKEYSDISVVMSRVLWDKIVRNDMVATLADYVRLKPSDVDERAFEGWLMNLEARADMEFLAAQNLLDIFEAFSRTTGTDLPSYDAVMAGETVSEECDLYVGTDGIRQAVIRFLSTVIESGADEIWLYSDLNMSWMVSDDLFRVKWAVLMSECVKRGTHIRIIHNIDRNLGEMTEAIRSWLPLYMSGMIEPYYCDKGTDARFSHTMFLCPGRCCVESVSVPGTEKEALFHYYTDQAHIEYYERAHIALLAMANPLLSVRGSSSVLSDSSDVTIIQETLTLATMPEELVDESGSELLKAEWKKRRKMMGEALKEQQIYECVPILGPEEAESETVMWETIPGVDEIEYKPGQYMLHIENMRRLSAQYPGFHICALPAAPFRSIRIYITDELVRITHMERPDLYFDFTHPLMCRAFKFYAERLRLS